MSTVHIIGDGPAGLSAALFLAKSDQRAVVHGADQTPMHHAQLYNYLGIQDISGTDFQTEARAHAVAHGAELHDEKVAAVEIRDGRFVIRTTSGESAGDYLVLAGGKQAQSLARDLGVEIVDGRVTVDCEYRTDVDRIYALGRLVRPDRSQAIISAGAGATAALDILSRETGTDVHDWDTPPEHDHDHPNL
jgi:thioredoxin reductase